MFELEARLRQALTLPLPGVDAQVRMAPRPRSGWRPGRVPAGTRDAAGLVLMYARGGAAHVLLTLRHADLNSHAGQVSLPGGAVDAGETFEQAARREAFEEVGLAPDRVCLIGALTPLHIPASDFLLHPIVGLADPEPQLRAADAEVERIVEAPIATLRAPATVRVERWNLRGHDADVPFFAIDDLRVWGATAMVLAELLTLLGSPPDPWNDRENAASQVVP